ncbi:hypothetical protein BABINDRAFT_7758 [Babjeviella inositovora NRRL Y-12698]|uniref:Non-classical export protein 1 n=1 Tax=Babjeviella inositovora NRRL Y-12698 TaxID=984486 RepID=A0A1E3QRP5_9ASCO|nr:uncharacterized protein BABINDRAFT_7758 [Babjeviella inositovora NRRL Y-12698]ODQ80308.1 hypothetical protein BABINDRAFT_7758 [Babjeviella inositovora NRRL Y-12698]
MSVQAPYLLSKWLDPVFSIAVGAAAYYSYEKRVGRKEGHTLNELVMKRFFESKRN